MKLRTAFSFIVLALFAVSALAVSCGDDNEGDGKTGLQIYLIDAPVDDAEEINMTVISASIRDGGWTDLDLEPVRFNLLDFQNDEGYALVQDELPAGDYDELRLVLECEGDDAPEIVIAGESYPLKVPSGCTSGFKIKGDFSISGGAEVVLILDFNARKSVTETAKGYNLNPVIRVIRAEDAGTISGLIEPAIERSAAFAFQDGTYANDNFDDAYNSTIARENGSFTIAALPAGTYDIVVSAEGFSSRLYEDIEVSAGEDTELPSTVELEDINP
jgi:Domain of unknown function (DUF4382)/Carboxypeptidase regulatory-like domain